MSDPGSIPGISTNASVFSEQYAFGCYSISVHIFILCRRRSAATNGLRSAIKNFGTVHIIEDEMIPDVSGFEGMCSHSVLPAGKKSSAWDKAFIGIDFEDSWFIEDDVAFSPSVFERLIERTDALAVDLCSCEITTQDADPDWYWWNKYPSYNFSKRSLNPFCRMSGDLIKKYPITG